MTDRNEATGAIDDLAAVQDEPLLFGIDEPVEVSRYTAVDAGLSISDLGSGQIASRLRVGRRMEIRIRGERGLVTSPIFSMQQLSDAHLVVATTSHLYVLTRIDASERLPRPALDQAAQDLAWGTPVPEVEPADLTRYARLGMEFVEGAIEGWNGAAVRIQVRRGDSVEELGLATLLEEPAPGASLRFALRTGGVTASTLVERVHADGDDVLEAKTANSTYRLERIDKDDD